MKRNVYVLVDETKNEFIGSVICRNDKDLKIQLDVAMQKEHADIDVKAYFAQQIELDDDNVVYSPHDTLECVWESTKSIQSNDVKGEINEEVNE